MADHSKQINAEQRALHTRSEPKYDAPDKAIEKAQATGAALAATGDEGIARALVASGFFPNIKTASQAIVKVQAGKELGFGPVASMMGIHIIETKGRVTVQLSANMIANLLRRGGYDFRGQPDDEACNLRFYRGKELIGESRFTMADAKRAGLLERDSPWKSHPRNMLWAAALRNGAKWFASEVLLGAPLPVEQANETNNSDVDIETGEIIEARDIRVVSEPPEGYAPNWAELWALARDKGLDRADVHGIFGVEEEEGALSDWVVRVSNESGKSIAQVVAEMVEQLRGYELVEVEEEVEQGVLDVPSS